jgi:integrase
MASITRHVRGGEVVYRVRVRRKGVPLQSAYFTRKTDAQKWARALEADLERNKFFPRSQAGCPTLADAIDRYERDVLQRKSKTYVQACQLRYWREHLGSIALTEITPPLIAEHRDRLTHEVTFKGLARAPATTNRYLAVLSHIFTIARKEWGWIEISPMDQVSKLKEPRGRVRFLDDEERERLLAVCKASANGDLYIAVALCLSTGARQDEIMSLRWPDVDLQRSMIIIHDTKNGERRSVPLLGHARELLRERNKVRRIDTDLLFPGKVHPQNPIDLRRPWTDALKAAAIEDFRWHDLRHSAASYLAMAGATPSELAAVLGHKTLAMVKRYAHLSEPHTLSVIERMNRAIFDE